MSLNWLLIWTVAISCGVGLANLFRQRRRLSLRFLPLLVVSATLLVEYVHDRSRAGYVAGAAWFLLLFLPGIASQIAHRLLGNRRFIPAYLLSWFACLLHPFDGLRDQPKLVRALWLLHRNERAEGIALLHQLRHRRSYPGRAAFVILTRLHGDWSGFLDAVESAANPESLLNDPLIANVYLQALGEVGQLDKMLENFKRRLGDRAHAGSTVMLNIARMKVAAFLGETQLVRQLLAGPLKHLDSDSRQFWIATSIQAAGNRDDAESLFKQLQQSPDTQIATAAGMRRVSPVQSQGTRFPEAEQLLSEIESELKHEFRFALVETPCSVFPVATCGLVVVLFGVFVGEMLNGEVGRIVWESTSMSWPEKWSMMLDNTTDNQNLYDLGALVLPPEGNADTHWRVFRSAFLHFGLLHLSMNVAGLLLFGVRLERAWGAVPTCIAYLACAVFSIYFMTLLPLGATAAAPYVLVGASGGVMGLIGCLLGYLGWGLLIRRNQLLWREFSLLFAIVMIQMVFDQMTPNVSSECHLLGLLIGLVCGLVVGVIRHGVPKLSTPQQTKSSPIG